MNRKLRWTWTALIAVAALTIVGAAPGAAQTKDGYLILYEKSADPASMQEIAREFAEDRKLELIVAPPNDYYEDNRIGTNAILCGKNADKEAVLNLARRLAGPEVDPEIRIDLLRIGPFPTPELNSARNSIDIRTVGDETYGEAYNPLDLSALTVDDFECGYGGRAALGPRNDSDTNPIRQALNGFNCAVHTFGSPTDEDIGKLIGKQIFDQVYDCRPASQATDPESFISKNTHTDLAQNRLPPGIFRTSVVYLLPKTAEIARDIARDLTARTDDKFEFSTQRGADFLAEGADPERVIIVFIVGRP